VHIQVLSGNGGDGAVSFCREKFVPRGGPDGGGGGSGGDVVVATGGGLTTLAHLRHKHVFQATPRPRGGTNYPPGSPSQSLLIPVPAGTIVTDEESGAIWDLSESGDSVVVGRGGEGGRGNARFANSVRQAPNFAEKGLPGEARQIKLELKLLADVGIVGLP